MSVRALQISRAIPARHIRTRTAIRHLVAHARLLRASGHSSCDARRTSTLHDVRRSRLNDASSDGSKSARRGHAVGDESQRGRSSSPALPSRDRCVDRPRMVSADFTGRPTRQGLAGIEFCRDRADPIRQYPLLIGHRRIATHGKECCLFLARRLRLWVASCRAVHGLRARTSDPSVPCP